MSAMRYIPNVVTLVFDESKCNGCGVCTTVCPHAVWAVENRKSRIADRDACMECGACARNCQKEAISVNAGVGCAAAVLNGIIKGTEPTCGCSTDGNDKGGCGC